MIIGACGFTGSGSSAVTDYLREFESVCVIDRPEFILSHSPDGLEDLDYQLNHHCCKYTSSEVAIKRFRRNVDNYLISKQKSKEKARAIEQCTDDFLAKIVQVSWMGFGSADLQLLSSKIERFLFSLSKRVIPYMPEPMRLNWKWYPAREMEFSIQPEDFYTHSREYVKQILSILGADFNKIVALNQPFSGTAPQDAFPFFDDPYAIVVDRDPRDQYVLAKMYYHRLGKIYQIPTQSAEDFVRYFKHMRSCSRLNEVQDNRTIQIRFEDMVYEYDRTAKVLNSFCGLDESLRAGHFFDPSMSVNNTQVYKRYPELKSDVAYIEKELEDYLFDFDKYGFVDTKGEMFFDSSPLNKH